MASNSRSSQSTTTTFYRHSTSEALFYPLPKIAWVDSGFPQFARLPQELQLMIVPHIIENEFQERKGRVKVRINFERSPYNKPTYVPRLPAIFRSNSLLRTEAIRFCTSENTLQTISVRRSYRRATMLFDPKRETLVFDCMKPFPSSWGISSRWDMYPDSDYYIFHAYMRKSLEFLKKLRCGEVGLRA